MPENLLDSPAVTPEKLAFSIRGMNIHRRIRQRREALGLSMETVAQLVGVSAWQTVQQWEKENGGTAPKRERLKKVAEALRTTPEFLMFGTETPDKPQQWERLSDDWIRMPVMWPSKIEGASEFVDVQGIEPSSFLYQVPDASNAPRFMPGEFAIVEPETVPEIEDDVLVRFTDGRIALMRLLSRRGGIRLGTWAEGLVITVDQADLTWMHYVAGLYPARKVRRI